MKIAFLFPGQGAQKQNMGKSFYENDADSRAVFDSVKTVTGIDACDLIFKDNDELNNTRYTQDLKQIYVQGLALESMKHCILAVR